MTRAPTPRNAIDLEGSAPAGETLAETHVAEHAAATRIATVVATNTGTHPAVGDVALPTTQSANVADAVAGAVVPDEAVATAHADLAGTAAGAQVAGREAQAVGTVRTHPVAGELIADHVRVSR